MICNNNINKEIYDSLKLHWTEVSREPEESNSLLKEEKIIETDGTIFDDTYSVKPFSGSINTFYTIKL